MNYEHDFALLVSKILANGELRKTRNGYTRSIFGTSLVVDMSDSNLFPILTGRKMYYKGVMGELAAMLRGPKHVKDFEAFGCNYWKDWANKDGSIEVDYGNAWLDYNGYNQLDWLLNTLRTNPTDRRLIITGWRPDKLDKLSLPCCHHTYQWYVRNGQYLDMLWMQRSVDTMIGLPSDVIFAAAWNVIIANEVGLKPGKLNFSLGDTHIYEEHREGAKEYINRVMFNPYPEAPRYDLVIQGSKVVDFLPEHINISHYHPLSPIKFELKA